MKSIPEQLEVKRNELEISCALLFPGDESNPYPGPQLLELIRHFCIEYDDPVPSWNQLWRDLPADKTFAQMLDHAVLTVLARRFPNAAPKTFLGDPGDSDGAFYLAHIKRMMEHLRTFLPEMADVVESESEGLSRLIPSAKRMTTTSSMFLRLGAGAIGLELRKLTGEHTRIRSLIGGPCGDGDVRFNDDKVTFWHGRQGLKSCAGAGREHSAAVHTKRNIRANFFSECGELIFRKVGGKELIKRVQNGRGIRASSREAGTDGNVLPYVNVYPGVANVRTLEKSLCRKVCCVPLNGAGDRRAARQVDVSVLGPRNGDGIAQAHCLHDHLDVMITILATAQNVQI